MKILVVGDPYMPVSVFEQALAPLVPAHEFSFLQIEGGNEGDVQAVPECAIGEYAGTPAEVARRLSDQEVLVVHGAPVTDSVLGASPKLALVGCARGGPVNVDLAAASRRRIPVVTTPGKNAEAVADLTLALWLMLARGLPAAIRFAAAEGNLGQSTFEGARFLGRDLGGQTAGLVGFGQVGTRVARRALAFGMTVLAYDPWVERARIDGVGIRACGFAELLAQSDFVSLHARSTPENANLFGRDQFEAMRPGACFVNTARETLVDEDALYHALVSGRLAGAALDVVRPRAAGGAHPLAALDQVILTPHIGGATRETLAHGAQMIAEEIRRFAAGEPPVHVVNREVL
jgi:D-3-phosphoglycerate dehydrogenase / 2-oxoglutarate reductase